MRLCANRREQENKNKRTRTTRRKIRGTPLRRALAPRLRRRCANISVSLGKLSSATGMGTQGGLWCLGAAESGYDLGSANHTVLQWPDRTRQPLPRNRAACNKVTDRLMTSGLGRFLTSGLTVQASYRGPDCGLRRGANVERHHIPGLHSPRR